MIILGNLGVAGKGLINLFLEAWWNFDSVTYKKLHKKFNGVGLDMVYDYILEELEGVK